MGSPPAFIAPKSPHYSHKHIASDNDSHGPTSSSGNSSLPPAANPATTVAAQYPSSALRPPYFLQQQPIAETDNGRGVATFISNEMNPAGLSCTEEALKLSEEMAMSLKETLAGHPFINTLDNLRNKRKALAEAIKAEVGREFIFGSELLLSSSDMQSQLDEAKGELQLAEHALVEESEKYKKHQHETGKAEILAETLIGQGKITSEHSFGKAAGVVKEKRKELEALLQLAPHMDDGFVIFNDDDGATEKYEELREPKSADVGRRGRALWEAEKALIEQMHAYEQPEQPPLVVE